MTHLVGSEFSRLSTTSRPVHGVLIMMPLLFLLFLVPLDGSANQMQPKPSFKKTESLQQQLSAIKRFSDHNRTFPVSQQHGIKLHWLVSNF